MRPDLSLVEPCWLQGSCTRDASGPLPSLSLFFSHLFPSLPVALSICHENFCLALFSPHFNIHQDVRSDFCTADVKTCASAEAALSQDIRRALSYAELPKNLQLNHRVIEQRETKAFISCNRCFFMWRAKERGGKFLNMQPGTEADSDYITSSTYSRHIQPATAIVFFSLSDISWIHFELQCCNFRGGGEIKAALIYVCVTLSTWVSILSRREGPIVVRIRSKRQV